MIPLENVRKYYGENIMGLLPLGTASQFVDQRKMIHNITPASYQRVSLRKLMEGFESSPYQRPPLDPMPNAAYAELKAIAGLALQRGIWPPLRLWNVENNFPYAHREANPDRLNIVSDFTKIPIPPSPKQPFRRDLITDRCFASMVDIVEYHVRSWDKRVNEGKKSTIEGALDLKDEIKMRSRFQEVSQKTFNRGQPVQPREVQKLNQFVLKNAHVGLMLAWSLVDLIPYLYRLHFNDQPSEDEHLSMVDCAIDDVLIDLATVHANVISRIEHHSFVGPFGPRFSILPRASGTEIVRYHFDPNDFRLYETTEGLKIHFSPEHLSRMAIEIPREIKSTKINHDLIHTGCPASIARADGEQSIIKYILDWMKIWMKR